MAEPAVSAGVPAFQSAVDAAHAAIAATTAEAAAEAEGVVAPAPVPVDDQAQENVLDHPEQSVGETPTVADGVFDDVAEELLTTPNPFTEGMQERDILEQAVSVEGFEAPIQVSELVNGYMRQADYTRKTQAHAENVKQFAAESTATSDLMEAMRTNPAGTIASLAVEIGLIEKADLRADVLAAINAKHSVPTREDVQKQVEARAKSLVEEDPRILDAQDAALMSQVQADFATLEEAQNLKFSDKDKEAILRHAVALETTRLDLAYLDLREKANRLRSARKVVQNASPASSKTGPVVDSTDTSPDSPAKTVVQAWQRAKATLADHA